MGTEHVSASASSSSSSSSLLRLPSQAWPRKRRGFALCHPGSVQACHCHAPLSSWLSSSATRGSPEKVADVHNNPSNSGKTKFFLNFLAAAAVVVVVADILNNCEKIVKCGTRERSEDEGHVISSDELGSGFDKGMNHRCSTCYAPADRFHGGGGGWLAT